MCGLYVQCVCIFTKHHMQMMKTSSEVVAECFTVRKEKPRVCVCVCVCCPILFHLSDIWTSSGKRQFVLVSIIVQCHSHVVNFWRAAFICESFDWRRQRLRVMLLSFHGTDGAAHVTASSSSELGMSGDVSPSGESSSRMLELMSPGEVVLGGVSGTSAEVLVKLSFIPFILRGLFSLRALWMFSTALVKLSPSSMWSSDPSPGLTDS